MKTQTQYTIKFFVVLILCVTAISLIVGGLIYKSSKDSESTVTLPRHRQVEVSLDFADSTEVFLVIGEGTSVGSLERIDVISEKKGMAYSIFSHLKLKPGAKVTLVFYQCFTTDHQGNPNVIPQIRKVL